MSRHSLAILSLALTALAACGDTSGVVAPSAKAPVAPSLAVSALPAPAGGVVAGQYIVTFKAGVANGPAKAVEKVGRANGHLKHTYSTVLNGFAAQLSDAAVAALRLDPDVAAIVPDPVVTIDATQSGATWGLDRLDQAALPLSTTYTYGNDGSGVTVYIVDTGINFSHVDFGGRAVTGIDEVTAGGTASDCHGHGTHVAGTVGGATYGVAKGVRLVAVRVLDCTGSGSGSAVLAGLDWIAQQKTASPSTPMVMNMSLGGSASQMLDDAVSTVIAKGVVAAVAAGNSTADACTTSPARLPAAITVGATDANDNFASFSNYGSCVDIEAPGVSITSDSYSSTTGTALMSGTSMATPHVAGAAALYLKANPAATPAQVASALTSNAVTTSKTVPSGTVNRLLNVSFLAPAAVATPSISITPKTASVVIGGTTALTASITNPVTGGTVSWVSRNTAVASVASTGATTATATAAGAGSTYIVASYVAGTTTVRDSALVTVAKPTIALSPTSASILVGAATTLTATIGNAGTSGSIAWTSRGTAIATVAATGATTASVTGVAAGSVYVVASYVAGNTTVRDSALVSVSAPAPSPAPTPSTVRFSNGAGYGCLTNSRDPLTATYEILAACDPANTRQTWTAPATGVAGTVVGAGSLCLTSGKSAGTVVSTSACSAGAATQQWTLTSAGELRVGVGYCAAALVQSWGVQVVLAACDGSAGQKWTKQ